MKIERQFRQPIEQRILLSLSPSVCVEWRGGQREERNRQREETDQFNTLETYILDLLPFGTESTLFPFLSPHFIYTSSHPLFFSISLTASIFVLLYFFLSDLHLQWAAQRREVSINVVRLDEACGEVGMVL